MVDNGRYVSRLVGLCICFLLLSACATAWQSEKLIASPPEKLPPRVELSDTPFFPQQEYQCGPAALATVLSHQQLDVSAEDLVPKVYLPARQGSLQIEIVATARSYGMLVYPISTQLEALFTEVAAGNPVLVLQNLAFSWVPRWHYAVVVGYDLKNAEVILRSGTVQRWRTSLDTFERTWQRAGYWGIVVVPPNRIPETAQALRFIKAAYDLEQTGQFSTALSAYHAASEKWPDTAEVWLTLGNATYTAEQMALASNAFQQVIKLKPHDTRGWNNLAYSLKAQGCGQQASKAIRCALRLSPDDANLHDSYREISTTDTTPNQTVNCPPIICPVGQDGTK